ncbi:uncharacterized protein LOC108596264 isoform X2 [Drosophila busckii]|uniref:uncharacterized protein LOC108596264 isoform X2 n=1 Tax=Drosophila busckii TaxID=30019 RepID=UPI00083F2902|nr:uncharacterized protein LOC108596264 isoform X2 [Drosophila busckii]
MFNFWQKCRRKNHVRAHFRASLETSEYENTSNLFHLTAAQQTQELLQRCETLLDNYVDSEQSPATTTSATATATATNGSNDETGCYLEMAAGTVEQPEPSVSLAATREYIELSSQGSLQSDKTFRQSLEPQVSHYDTCQQQEQPMQQQQQQQQQQQLEDEEQETQQVFTHELFINCPYAELPAGHLVLQRSTKFGQLQRIEKRLFFDQSKKYYCGILNDWMLCYADGPTACRPSSSLYLKSSAIEIEHFGEGKRREICFQITTADPGKKFVYQANNEVDAKEWIHAIESAIRGDALLKPNRKLPTPPVQKRHSYVTPTPNSNDSIYEEPSPIYNYNEFSSAASQSQSLSSPPRLPEKNNSPSALARRFEYDIPKCPAQPLAEQQQLETSELIQPQTQLDFQAKVKSVHSELSSQLCSAQERLKQSPKKCYDSSEQKKQRKSPQLTPSKDKESDKLARSWFLGRLKSGTGVSSSAGAGARNAANVNSSSSLNANAKCKISEKENLLNGLDLCDGKEDTQSSSSNPTSPCLKSDAKSKVNMIINQFESSGHLSTMFSVEALAANALASLTSFCESDNCNNYEPISLLKKV